jgi:hypothetical protein
MMVGTAAELHGIHVCLDVNHASLARAFYGNLTRTMGEQDERKPHMDAAMDLEGSRPEVDELRTRIETILLRESQDFFDAPEDRSAMENTVRICCEFGDFLSRTEAGSPDASETNYVLGSIRSGMDDYFAMEQWGRILAGLKLQDGFTDELPNRFVALKTDYDATFQQLLACTASVKAFGLLLSLVRLMLLFQAVYFQYFLSYSAADASTSD